jgi:hypothetical protein
VIRTRRFFLMSALLACAVFASAQQPDWLPITRQDLRIKEAPGIPGAPAIQLFYAHYIDDAEGTEFFYSRIKVLNKKGSHYADVEILVPPEASISGLKARTIHPDGKIIEFTGKPFQKTVIKERGFKVTARAFTLPAVTVGSIIEYKYKIGLPGVVLDNAWNIQHELYTVKESFRMKPFGGLLEGFEKGHQVAALSSHMPDHLKPRQRGDGYELEVENMPPFEPEGYMPPEEDYKPQIRFFYGWLEVASADKFWQEAGRQWNEEAERFIGRRREIAEEAARVVGEEAGRERQLRRLYARAQEIRNLSYERERTGQEEKKENLKPNQNALDVLAHGYGDRKDVGRFFVALARAAGFEASVLRVSDRSEKFFDPGLLSTRQLDAEIVLVNDGGRDFFLDPGTRFAPFGLVRWIYTSTTALKLEKNGGTFLKVPAAAYDKAVLQRSAEMVLDAGGGLQGTITASFEGGEALERRLDALSTDEAGREEELEQEARSWLPPGTSVRLKSAEGWQQSEGPLVAVFTVELPSYAVVAGKRLVLPACIFQWRQMEPFQHKDRKYPVYFPYAFGQTDAVAIRVPAENSLESLPPRQAENLSYARYFNETEFDGRQLVTHRVLQVNGIFFQVETYPEIKDFFRKVQTGDEQQTVVRAEAW